MRYAFDQFEFDTGSQQLVDKDGHAIALRPQALKVLTYLIERAPSVVSRAELLAGVWGHTALSASGVSQAIREIRRALRDNAAQPRIIATRHGCGYQVVTRVIEIQAPESDPPAVQSGRSSTALISGMLGAAVLVGLAGGMYWSHPEATPSHPFSGQPRWVDYASQLIAFPSDPAARAGFLAGERHLSEMNWKQAVERFEDSREIEPETSMSTFRLIEAYTRAGFDARARELIDHTAPQRATMNRREQLEFRALVARSTGNWEEVVHCMRTLAEFFPGELDYHFGLFEALLASRPPEYAAEALRDIEEMLGDESRDVRYLLALHALNARLHQPAEALAAARLATDAADASGLASLQARAELALGRALDRIEDRAASREALRRAATAMKAAHDDVGYAEVLGELARHDLRERRISDAREKILRACAISESIGHDLGTAHCARNRAEVQMKIGRYTQAEPLFADAAARYARAGRLRLSAQTSLQLTRIQLQSKRIAEAEQHLSRAARAYERIGDRGGFAWVRHMIGKVLRCKGKLPEALAAYAEARTIFQSIDLPTAEMASIIEMAGLQTAQGNDELALALFDQATDLTKAPDLLENVEVFARARSSRKQLSPSCADSEGR